MSGSVRTPTAEDRAIPMQGNPLAETDRPYRLLVEAVVDYAIYLIDLSGRIASWNPGARRLKGYEAEEVIGQPFSLFFTEEDRRLGRPEAALETARRHGRFEAEGWRVRKDGTRFWALAVLDAVRDRDGTVIGFAKVTRDMTERREAQQALVESERRFRLLVQGVTDYAIFMLDPAGRVANWNAGARRIKGWAAEEIVGQHFSRFYTEEDRAAGVPQRALEQAERTGRFEAEGWRVRKDGSRFWASVVIHAIRDDEGGDGSGRGALVGFAKVTRDITERREAQRAMDALREQMAQAQKLEALGQLTGGIAHTFSNLLQIVMSGVRLAQGLAGDNERLGRVLADIGEAAESRAGLTRHLLAFARKLPTRPEVIDTAGHLRRAADLFGPSLRGDIQVDLDLEEGLWPIRVDAAQFELALLNVALNARDAMPQGGLLAVSARNEALREAAPGLRGRFVAVRLRDTGTGIPEEVLGRVFEPFFTTKPPGQGTGLGLSQAHGFAEAAGGALRIESEPGRGTEVTFFLPAAAAARSDAARGDAHVQAADPGTPAPGHRAARVLVVDDEAAVGRLAAGMLEGAGYRAEAVTGPEAALERLEGGERFDLVFSDVLMPGGMSGLDLAREVGRRWPDLPVLLATGRPGRRRPGRVPGAAQALRHAGTHAGRGGAAAAERAGTGRLTSGSGGLVRCPQHDRCAGSAARSPGRSSFMPAAKAPKKGVLSRGGSAGLRPALRRFGPRGGGGAFARASGDDPRRNVGAAEHPAVRRVLHEAAAVAAPGRRGLAAAARPAFVNGDERAARVVFLVLPPPAPGHARPRQRRGGDLAQRVPGGDTERLLEREHGASPQPSVLGQPRRSAVAGRSHRRPATSLRPVGVAPLSRPRCGAAAPPRSWAASASARRLRTARRCARGPPCRTARTTARSARRCTRCRPAPCRRTWRSRSAPRPAARRPSVRSRRPRGPRPASP